jgi:predicted TPR repeat methyltransferase
MISNTDKANAAAQGASRQASTPPKGAGVDPGTYPLFTAPEEYLRFREPAGWLGFLKRWSERRAIARCLNKVKDVRCVCDAPCGPGRLFPVWRRWFSSVIGVELSDPMVEAARQRLGLLKVAGEVRKGDVFHLRQAIREPADLVASVRFCYYFDRTGRVQLLRSLAAASRRYVLVQYKTRQTVKGRQNAARTANRMNSLRSPKHFCSDAEIREELAEAGLKCLLISPIGWFSDRTFVLAEKVGTAP